MSANLWPWVKLPTHWVRDFGLKNFGWSQEQGANEIAALTLLLALAHFADRETGIAKMTYNDLKQATGISRDKISKGLQILADRKIVKTWVDGQSSIKICDFEQENGWCKIPAKSMYIQNKLHFMEVFHLRKRAELDALKIYLLIASFRDRHANISHVSYDKIVEYSSIDRKHIKAAISLLAATGLVYIERFESNVNEFAIANAYRLPNLDSYRHQGTIGRTSL